MKKSFILALTILISACTTNKSHMSVIAPENVQINAQALNNARIVKNVESSDTTPILFVINLGQPKFDKVVDDVIKQGAGDLLVNAQIEETTNWYVLFGTNSIKINADVVQLNRQ